MNDRFGDTVRIEAVGHVAVVTIDRPPHNHLSAELMRDLADALEAIDADVSLRASLIQSEGTNFCAGADLVSNEGVGAAGMAGIKQLYGHAMRLFALDKPIVAAVQGGAIGAGLGLAIAADFRVASANARFAANFVKLGFHPGLGMSFTLPRLIGPARAERMFLSGSRIKPEQALTWGLVDEVVPLETLRASALAFATEIASNAPLALHAIRKTLRGNIAAAVRVANEHEYREQAKLFETNDFREGIRAVTERRPGDFTGS